MLSATEDIHISDKNVWMMDMTIRYMAENMKYMLCNFKNTVSRM